MSVGENAGIAEADLTDEALILRLQEKDISALGHLYLRYARLVYSLSSRIIRDQAEAEDLVHEVFLSLYRRCGSFDPAKGTARSWLVQLTYHKCFDWRDYLKARHGIQQGNGDGEGSALPLELKSDSVKNPDPVEQAMRLDVVKLVREGFTRLPSEQQLAFRLRVQGYSFTEIAQKLGCSDGNAKNHVYRGARRLREVVFNGNGRKPSAADQNTKFHVKSASQ